METETNLELCCRACLEEVPPSNSKNQNAKFSLFQTHNLSFNFSLVTSQTVNEGDGLPQYLCETCFHKINYFKEFRKKCDENKQYLMNVISTKTIIKEEVEHIALSTIETLSRGANMTKCSAEIVNETANSNMHIKMEQSCPEDGYFEMAEVSEENYENDESLLPSMVRTSILEENQKLMIRNQSKILAILGNNTSFSTSIFPLHTIEQLEEVNQEISCNMDHYIKQLKNILNPGGIVKNLCRIIDDSLVVKLNYDGVCDKKGFKEFKAINLAIFEALRTEGYIERIYIQEIRNGFKLAKNRFHKKMYDHRKTLNKRKKLTS